MRRLGLLVLFGLLVASLAPVGSVQAKPNSLDDDYLPVYFKETGYWLQGEFREYWENRGGLFVHGYPISGVFKEGDLYVQYFERSIFEFHPELVGTGYEVLLRRLGAENTQSRLAEDPFLRIGEFENSEDHVYYPQTGHSLNYGFKTFWNKYDGLRNFGYPISEEFQEQNQPPPAGDGQIHIVQYFERARFEYHPEYRGTDYEVLLGLLGREYAQQHPAPEEAARFQNADLPPRDPIADIQRGPHVGYGFNMYYKGSFQDETAADFHQKSFDMINNAGFSWVRFQVNWGEVEPRRGQYDFAPIDRIFNHAHLNGLRILASVVKAPTWADPNGGIPADVAPFRTLMETLAARYPTQVQAWEIWNEQNLAWETGGYVDVGRYVELLKAGYNGVRAGNPAAIVVFGGLTPNGVNDPSIAIDDVNYLRQIYAYNNGEIKNYFDVLGAHPGSNGNPPDTMWPNNPGAGPGWNNHESFYFRRVQQLRQVMLDNGDGRKQVWLTEFGWTTANQAPGYEYGAQNTEQEQAQFLVRSFEIAKQEWPWMGVMFVWNLNYSTITQPSDEKHPWSVVYADWTPRPSYEALKQMPK